MEERKEMLEAMTSELENVTVDTFEGLLVNYCIQKNANAVLRGIRAVSDYEFELQMALMNRKMEPRVETVFMMPAEKVFLSQLAHRARNRQVGRPVDRTRAGAGRGAASAQKIAAVPHSPLTELISV